MAIDLAGIKAAGIAQGGVYTDPAIEAQLAAIEANKKVNPVVQGTIDREGIAAAAAIQDANTVKDPAIIAQAQANEAALAQIDANRKVQPDVPATVDYSGIQAAAAAQEAAIVKTPELIAQREQNAAQIASLNETMSTPKKEVSTDEMFASAKATQDAASGAASAPQKEVPVTTQTFDDGSKLETYADGSTVSTDTEGAMSFNSATVPAVASDKTNSDAFVGPSPAPNQSTLAVATAVPDWRVKLKLARNAKYLYGAAKPGDILYPLNKTNGVVFPYTPAIQTAYRASYDPTDLTHSNYRMYFYKNSHIDDITLTCDFTAQDSEEASYVLAVIHFFKSVTKMFYGKDIAPSAGTPPPLVFLSGYGQYQFNNHPMLISSFTYNLPNDVDYIRASTGSSLSLTASGGVSASNASSIPGIDFIKSRLLGANLNKGGATSQPSFTVKATGEPTYVPTKIQIQLTCLPVVTRSDVSEHFSVSEYAKGNLAKRSTGGIW